MSGQHFEYLIGRLNEPSELFGALSIDALRDGRVEAVTDGMLPEAIIAFLDEVFFGSTAILSTLLTDPATCDSGLHQSGYSRHAKDRFGGLQPDDGLPEGHWPP